MAANAAQGTTVTLGSQGTSLLLLNFAAPNQTNTPLETSTLSTTGAKTRIANDLGDVPPTSMSVQYDDTAAHPVIGTSNESITFDPGGGGKNIAACGYVSGFAVTGEIDGIMLAEVEFTYSGEIIKTT